VFAGHILMQACKLLPGQAEEVGTGLSRTVIGFGVESRFNCSSIERSIVIGIDPQYFSLPLKVQPAWMSPSLLALRHCRHCMRHVGFGFPVTAQPLHVLPSDIKH
jgi:hypothetical protein